jgi:hypothetical protein
MPDQGLFASEHISRSLLATGSRRARHERRAVSMARLVARRLAPFGIAIEPFPKPPRYHEFEADEARS